MSKLKTSLLAAAAAVAVFGATSASAASWQIWNGSAWVADGTTHLVGGTTASYFGNSLPCNADDFTVKITAGVATVTAVTFGNSPTSSACSGIVSKGLPWKVTINTVTSTGGTITIGDTASSTTTVGGVNVFIPAPLNANCPSASGRAPVSGTVTNPTGTPPGTARVSFSGSLGPCSVASTVPPAPALPHLNTTGYPSARLIP